MPPDYASGRARHQEPTGGPSAETAKLKRTADEILAREGITISPSKRSRLVRKYQRNPDRTNGLRDFLLDNCAEGHIRWAIGGFDPTARQAIRNVEKVG